MRGLVKLAFVVVAAGGAGLLLGLGFSKLSGGSAAQTPVGAASRPASGSVAAPGVSTGSSSTTTPRSTTPPGGVGTTNARPTPAPVGSLAQIHVNVLSATLHPAATPAGRQRRRARLNVRIMATNSGKLVVTPPRPALVVNGLTVRTDPKADAPGLRFGPLAAGTTANVTLQFEIAGSLTTQITNQGSARIVVAGHSLTVAVALGPPVAVAGGQGGP